MLHDGGEDSRLFRLNWSNRRASIVSTHGKHENSSTLFSKCYSSTCSFTLVQCLNGRISLHYQTLNSCPPLINVNENIPKWFYPFTDSHYESPTGDKVVDVENHLEDEKTFGKLNERRCMQILPNTPMSLETLKFKMTLVIHSGKC